MKILITGACGFIGMNMVKHLAASGENLELILLDKRETDVIKDLVYLANYMGKKENIEMSFTKLDITDEERMFHFMQAHKPDVVIHLAGSAGVRDSFKLPYRFLEDNVLGTTVLLEAMRHAGTKNIVFASSSAVYGEKMNFQEWKKGSKTPEYIATNPISLYGATKAAQEGLIEAYASKYNMHAVGLRLFSVYGPWQREGLFMIEAIKAAYAEVSVPIYGNGEQGRDFTYISDVLYAFDRATALAMSLTQLEKSYYEIINICTGVTLSLTEVMRIIRIHTNKNLIGEMNAATPADAADVLITCGSNQKAKDIFNWSPGIDIDIDTGIQLMVKWYKNYGKNNPSDTQGLAATL